jgi:hypothetical protein
MNLVIYVRNPEHFLKGDMFMGLGICAKEEEYFWENEQVVAEIDLDVESVDRGTIVKQAIGLIEEEEKKVLLEQEEKLQRIERRKGELLALPSGVTNEFI